MERAFRLAGLLRLRELQEEQAAAQLAASNASLQRAHRYREATLTALTGHTLPAAADPHAWRAAVAGRAVLRDRLADAGADVAQAAELVVADTASWAAARSRSVGLEKLHDKHRALVGAEDARAEQHALDEVAARTARTDRSLSRAAGVPR